MRLTFSVSTNQPKRFRPTISAVKSEARMPRVSEIAKPLTGPLAFQKRIAAVISVVTLASKMERERLLVSGLQRDLERLSEREFLPQSLVNEHAASTARPIVRMMPAIPGQREDEVEHGQRAHQQDDVYDQRDVRDQAGESVVDHYQHESDREAEQTGKNARSESSRARGSARRCVLPPR